MKPSLSSSPILIIQNYIPPGDRYPTILWLWCDIEKCCWWDSCWKLHWENQWINSR
jgi:hypothetical protein